MLGVTVDFAIGFGTFVVLMVVLAVFVLRFAIREGRRRQPSAGPGTAPDPEGGTYPDGRPGSN
jgi:hypothetical protein